MTYDYCPEGYMTTGWSTTILKTSVGFTALLVLAGALAFLVLAFKEFKIDK